MSSTKPVLKTGSFVEKLEAFVYGFVETILPSNLDKNSSKLQVFGNKTSSFGGLRGLSRRCSVYMHFLLCDSEAGQITEKRQSIVT